MKNDAAVLLIAFGRVDYARRTFEAIKAAKPSKFYFYTNAGRPDHPDECKRNEQVKAMAKEVNWPCEFKTWFRDEPIGVLDSIRLAIEWVFQNEEKAIIMEEDCVGAPAWFDFANNMLDKYADDDRVWMISGSNYAENHNPLKHSYHFSRNYFINGWASWRDRWMQIDWEHLNFEKMVSSGLIDSYYPDSKQRKYHENKILQYGREIEKSLCWDFVFWYTAVSHYAFCITPSRHLVQNIGIEGEHAGLLARLNGGKLKIPYNEITFNQNKLDISNPPAYVCPDNSFDKEVYKNWLSKTRVWYIEIPRKIYHFFKKRQQ